MVGWVFVSMRDFTVCSLGLFWCGADSRFSCFHDRSNDPMNCDRIFEARCSTAAILQINGGGWMARETGEWMALALAVCRLESSQQRANTLDGRAGDRGVCLGVPRLRVPPSYLIAIK